MPPEHANGNGQFVRFFRGFFVGAGRIPPGPKPGLSKAQSGWRPSRWTDANRSRPPTSGDGDHGTGVNGANRVGLPGGATDRGAGRVSSSRPVDASTTSSSPPATTWMRTTGTPSASPVVTAY